MNETPPPLANNVEYQPPQPRRGLSTGAKWGIGCGSGCLVVLLILGVLAWLGWVAFEKNVIDRFTSDTPVAIEAPEADPATVDAVVARFDSFREAMEQEKDVGPLSLTGEEINILVNHHPDWKPMAGHVAVQIEGDQLKGQISLPLGEILGLLKGRYLNGKATIRIALKDGMVEGYIDDFEFAGQSPPPEVVAEMRKQNIFEEARSDPEMQRLFESIQSLEVKNGQLIIVPKPAAERKPSGGSGSGKPGRTAPVQSAEAPAAPVEA